MQTISLMAKQWTQFLFIFWKLHLHIWFGITSNLFTAFCYNTYILVLHGNNCKLTDPLLAPSSSMTLDFFSLIILSILQCARFWWRLKPSLVAEGCKQRANILYPYKVLFPFLSNQLSEADDKYLKWKINLKMDIIRSLAGLLVHELLFFLFQVVRLHNNINVKRSIKTQIISRPLKLYTQTTAKTPSSDRPLEVSKWQL